MIKKKLLIVIGALLILNLSLAGCGKSTEANSTTASTSSNEDKTKELDKKYIESIKPYILNVGNDWGDLSDLSSNSTDISSNNLKIKMSSTFENIKENWKKIFNIQIKDTPNITEIKKVLKNINELQEKAMNEYSEGLNNSNKDEIKQATEYLNKSDELIKKDLAPIVKKMTE